MDLHALDDWQDAPALVLSCPGPLRRHAASILPLDQATLAQVFLGAESQLLAFAAAFPHMRAKMFFAPLPEMFSAAASLPGVWPGKAEATPLKQVVHLRFGSVRDARLLKGVRNLAVVAEAPGGPLISASRHPFASGDVLPAGVESVLTYTPAGAAPSTAGRARLPVSCLPPACVTADLAAAASIRASGAGVDLVSLAEFDPAAWIEGGMGTGAGGAPKEPSVLIPWNMAQYCGVVPELLTRLAALQGGGVALPRLVLLPFNDTGQGELIRALIDRLTGAAARPSSLLGRVFLARVTSLGGLPALRKLASVAWVDGGDPEAWWTLARLRETGFSPLVLGTARGEPPGFPADDLVELGADTRFGPLRVLARLPAVRDLAGLLATAEAKPRPRSGGRA